MLETFRKPLNLTAKKSELRNGPSLVAMLLLLNFFAFARSVGQSIPNSIATIAVQDYSLEKEEEVADLVRENIAHIHLGHRLVEEGFVSSEFFEEHGLQEIRELIAHASFRKVLVKGNKVVGFAMGTAKREPSREVIRRAHLANGLIPPDDHTISWRFPGIKEKDVDCCDLIELNLIIIKNECRDMGHGTFLWNAVIGILREEFPHITRVMVRINNSNEVGIRFFLRKGFERSRLQNSTVVMCGALFYEKELEPESV